MGRETRAVWEKRVARWRDSNLSAKEFAAEVGINAGTLSYWAWRVERKDGAKAKGRPQQQDRREPLEATNGAPWLELVPTAVDVPKTVDPPASAPVLELVIASGRTIRVPAGFDAEALARLLAVLEGR